MAEKPGGKAVAVVECRSEVRAENEQHLLAHEVKAWLAGVPEGAHITAITVERGHQRDPYTETVGLRATWSEVRRA